MLIYSCQTKWDAEGKKREIEKSQLPHCAKRRMGTGAESTASGLRSPGFLSQLLTPRDNLSLELRGRVTILPKLRHTEVLLVALGREVEKGEGEVTMQNLKPDRGSRLGGGRYILLSLHLSLSYFCLHFLNKRCWLKEKY